MSYELGVVRPDGTEFSYAGESKADAADKILKVFVDERIWIPYAEAMRVRGEVIASPEGQMRRHHDTGYSFTIKSR